MKKTVVALMASLVVAGCGDPATFRPARNVSPYPAVPTAYRVKEPDSMCESIGFVIEATSIDHIARTTANHGGTHYRVLDDFGDTTIETNTTAGQTFGVVHARSTSRAVQNHAFTAEAYRCAH